MANQTYTPPYESKGTKTTTPAAPLYGKDVENLAKQLPDTRKQACEKKGGTWDETRKICIMPQPAEVTKLTSPEVFKNEKGNPAGITLPDGRTFLGLSPNDVETIAADELKKTQLPEGTQMAGTARAATETQQRTQQLLQMAQQGLLTPEELRAIGGADVDIGQALGAGGISVLPGLVGGAATGAGLGILGATASGAGAGAALGSVAGPVAIATGALGALTGFIYGVRNSIKGQQVNEFAKDQVALTRGRTYLRFLVADTNSNPNHAEENIALFYQALNMIDAAHAKTYKDSQENLNKWVSADGTEKLAQFQIFDNTLRASYIRNFNEAVLNPDPNKGLATWTEDDINTAMEAIA